MRPALPTPYAPRSLSDPRWLVRVTVFAAGIALSPALVHSLNELEGFRGLRIAEVLWVVTLLSALFAWVVAGSAASWWRVTLRCVLGGTTAGVVSGLLIWAEVSQFRDVIPESALLGGPFGLVFGIMCLWPTLVAAACRRHTSLAGNHRVFVHCGLWLAIVAGASWAMLMDSAWQVVPAAALGYAGPATWLGVVRGARMREWIRRVRDAEEPGWEIRELSSEPTDDLPLLFWLPNTRWYDLLVHSGGGESAYRFPAAGTAVALIPKRQWPQ